MLLTIKRFSMDSKKISQAENYLNEIEYRISILDDVWNEYNNISMLLTGLRRLYDDGRKVYLLRASVLGGKIQVSREDVYRLIERCIHNLEVIE